jgi:hypothetical protein
MKELKLNNSNRVALAHDGITSMALQETDAMIGVSGRWWCFPGAQIDGDSWEGEWRNDGRVYLYDDAGKVVESTEVSEAETEQMSREALLADVLELAVERLRSGEGWNEATTDDLLREILRVYPALVKKPFALALLSESL